jgi:hypothetical protein
MKNLSVNWLTEHLVDLEYKQFILLAYLDEVHQEFNHKRLYPVLSDLIEHYRNLKAFKSNAQQLYNSFKGEITAFDLENFRVLYQKVVSNDSIMLEIEQIIDFSLPQFEKHLKNGKEIYEYTEHHLKMEEIGLTPLNKNAGYILIEYFKTRETQVYTYELSVIENAQTLSRGIYTKYFKSFTRGFFTTPETIKIELIKENQALPNPATFFFTTEIEIPFESTYFPIAKRMLLRAISK